MDSREDSVALQEDLDGLQIWTEEWQVKFGAERCRVLGVGGGGWWSGVSP